VENLLASLAYTIIDKAEEILLWTNDVAYFVIASVTENKKVL